MGPCSLHASLADYSAWVQCTPIVHLFMWPMDCSMVAQSCQPQQQIQPATKANKEPTKAKKEPTKASRELTKANELPTTNTNEKSNNSFMKLFLLLAHLLLLLLGGTSNKSKHEVDRCHQSHLVGGRPEQLCNVLSPHKGYGYHPYVQAFPDVLNKVTEVRTTRSTLRECWFGVVESAVQACHLQSETGDIRVLYLLLLLVLPSSNKSKWVGNKNKFMKLLFRVLICVVCCW